MEKCDAFGFKDGDNTIFIINFFVKNIHFIVNTVFTMKFRHIFRKYPLNFVNNLDFWIE